MHARIPALHVSVQLISRCPDLTPPTALNRWLSVRVLNPPLQGGATVDALNSLAPWFGSAISVQGGMFCAENLTTGYTPLQARGGWCLLG